MSSILWLNWKDHRHPASGGAEVVLLELARRQVAAGHQVSILTAEYGRAAKRERLEGIEFIRVGSSRYTHSFQAIVHYLRHMRGQYQVVIEVVNTAPYFAPLFGGDSKFFLFYHQLAREIWYHETKPPLSQLGYYLLEPVASRLLGRSRARVVTVSDSTKQDLAQNGFKPQRIQVIGQGSNTPPLPSLAASQPKYTRPTLLSLGAMRSMKQTLHQLRAFELAKQQMPDLQLKLVGSSQGVYGQAVLAAIAASPYAADIDYLGRLPQADKLAVLQQSHLVLVTSIKEGWCLVVTEANSQGTPAIAYDTDGLRDSIRPGITGHLIKKDDTAAMAAKIVSVLNDPAHYQALRQAGWEWSGELTFDAVFNQLEEQIAS